MASNVPLDLQGFNLYLIGMMGVGKSTTAQLLAPRFRYRACDLDAEIEKIANCKISTIFAQQGEAAFRDLESQAMVQVAARSRLVVATGGGVILKAQNCQALQQGIVVWLDVSQETLWQRLKTDQSRPLLQTEAPYETIGNLLRERAPLYGAVADITVMVEASWCPAQVVKQVMAALQEQGALPNRLQG